MPRHATLIFNPVAGQRDPDRDLDLICQSLRSQFELDIVYTTEEIGADKRAEEAIEAGAEMVIASGGDGTLSKAAKALLETEIPLGVISRGTANAFATALGIPAGITAACETILAGETRVVDAARCNGEPMVLLAGIGFEAEAVDRVGRGMKDRFGMLAYLISGLRQLRSFDRFAVEITTETKTVRTRAAAVTVANAAPPTSILAQGPPKVASDDGLLDITIVASETMAEAISDAYSLLRSALEDDPVDRPHIGYLRAKRVKVTTDPPQKVVVDGDMRGETPIEFECVPKALTIFTPKARANQRTESLEGLPDLEVIED
mgnify:CR=1 FL=1